MIETLKAPRTTHTTTVTGRITGKPIGIATFERRITVTEIVCVTTYDHSTDTASHYVTYNGLPTDDSYRGDRPWSRNRCDVVSLDDNVTTALETIESHNVTTCLKNHEMWGLAQSARKGTA